MGQWNGDCQVGDSCRFINLPVTDLSTPWTPTSRSQFCYTAHQQAVEPPDIDLLVAV